MGLVMLYGTLELRLISIFSSAVGE